MEVDVLDGFFETVDHPDGEFEVEVFGVPVFRGSGADLGPARVLARGLIADQLAPARSELRQGGRGRLNMTGNPLDDHRGILSRCPGSDAVA